MRVSEGLMVLLIFGLLSWSALKEVPNLPVSENDVFNKSVMLNVEALTDPGKLFTTSGAVGIVGGVLGYLSGGWQSALTAGLVSFIATFVSMPSLIFLSISSAPLLVKYLFAGLWLYTALSIVGNALAGRW